MSNLGRTSRRKCIGIVTSNKANKTITVKITKKEKHPRYGKYINKTTQLMAHDEQNACNINDKVLLMATRPQSKKKHFRLVEILQPT